MPLGRFHATLFSAAVSIVAASCAGHSAATGEPVSSPRPDSALAVASFDTVWRLIRDTHYDEGMKGLDWSAIGDELRPRVQRARSTAAVRGAITDLLSRLGDSHYSIIPAEAVATPDSTHRRVGPQFGDVGMDVRLVDGGFVISRIDADGAAAAAGVHAGWLVEGVDSFATTSLASAVARTPGTAERRVAAIHAALSVSRRFGGEAGSNTRLQLRDGRDRQIELVVPRRDVSANLVRIGNLPPILARLDTVRLQDAEGCVGLIRMTTWMPVLAAPFERALRAYRSCRGIVMDLRGNLGGVAAMVMGTSGWFLNRADTLGILRTRDAELRYVAIPQLASGDGRRAEPYAGPLALIVDAHSASTSEMFAAGLQDAARARVFGDTTAGQALPATLRRLPNQDVLMYAVADFVTKHGVRLDGRGVVPNEVTPLRRADLLAGRDVALAAAIRWVRAELPRASTP